MNDHARRIATYQDVLDAPPHVVAEIISGGAVPVAASWHPARSRGFGAGRRAGAPFKRWRRERLPELPQAAFIELSPDWACEVASASTRRLDRGEKLHVYAQHSVRHVWLVEPLDQLLEVLELDRGSYRIIRSVTGDQPVRLEPFDAIQLELSALWAR